MYRTLLLCILIFIMVIIFNNEMIYDENDKILKLYFLSAGGRERLLIIVSISKQFHSDIENI